MKQKIIKLLLMLSLLVPLRMVTESAQSTLDMNALDEQLNLVYIDEHVSKSITELECLFPHHNWSKTFKDLCMDMHDEGNVASYEQVDEVIKECLKVCNDQLCPLQEHLNKYKETLDSGEASIKLSEMDGQPDQLQTRSKCKKFCRLSVRCLTVTNGLSVNGQFLVNGVNFVPLAGVAGAIGAAGAAGPQGVPGIPGLGGVLGYGYIYNFTGQAVAVNADVFFDTNGPLLGVTHTPAADPTGFPITVVNAGTYLINFSVSGTPPNQFAITVNGAVNNSTVYGAGGGSAQNYGQAILVLAAGDVLTLRNNVSAAAVGLDPMIGGTQNNVNASVRIIRLT